MRKLYSLIKTCMTNDMSLFKIKTSGNSKSSKLMPIIFISFCFMFAIWSNANILFEKFAPLHLQFIVLSIFVFGTSLVTLIEGIYKSGPLIFNCKDDQLLLSLPIKRRTVLFVRIFKFYVFELLFNSLFIIPLIIAYIRWADSIDYTFFITSIIMILTLPIIPIVLSCIIGAITSSFVSRFKYKNIVHIVLAMVFILAMMYLSFNMENFVDYLVKNSSSINDLITKIYYPAGLYANLVIKFNLFDLIKYILINIFIFIITIYILSKFYFSINSRLKKVVTTSKVNFEDLKIKSKSIYESLIKKELNTFFKTPVFIINAGFSLVLFILAVIIIMVKFDSVLPILIDPKGLNLEEYYVMNNLSIIIFILIIITSFLTSITNSLISLEGKNINIIKSLPVKTKTVLMSKIYSSLVITSPVLIIGTILLSIKFRINIIEILLLLILSILLPLVSHFIGLIINLKYPKLDFESSTEVVKQSTSSFISVMIGMLILVVNIIIITNIFGKVNSLLILFLAVIIYLIVDTILYLYLINKGSKLFNNLSI